MKKIPTLFLRNPDNMSRVLTTVNTECQWVIDGEGVATRKYDGTCCYLHIADIFMKRYELRPGKIPPDGFKPTGDPDPITGKQPGWVPVSFDDPNDKRHVEAYKRATEYPHPDFVGGTCELVGPKVNGNPEKWPHHELIWHSEADQYPGVPRTFDGIKAWLSEMDIEGLVFHHPDGRMSKIKKRDFGLKR